MSKRTVVAIFVALLLVTLMLVVWIYGHSLTDDVAIQRFSASATAIAAVAGLLAFAALMVYTVETYNLRTVAQRQVEVAQQQVKEAQIQNETAIRPVLSFDVTERKLVVGVNVDNMEETVQTVDDAFVIRNLGLGPAFNIWAKFNSEDVELDILPTILGQGQIVPVGVVVFSETPEQRAYRAISQIKSVFQDDKLPERIEVTITCESTNRARHQTRYALVYNHNTDALWIEFLAAE